MRIIGILYLIIIVCGIFAEGGVRANLAVPGDADATAANIMGSTGLFRLGFVADSIMLMSDVAVAILLYVLLRPINRTLSLTAAAFRLTQAAILGFNLLIYYAVILLLHGEAYRAVFTSGQLHSLALLFLEMHSHGYDLGLLFFGLSNLIVGWLVGRSGYMPRILGYGLIAAGFVYLAGSYTRFVTPGFVSTIAPAYIVPLIAELGFCLWLLANGLRPRNSHV
jgi:hypothetical protein